MRRIWKSARSTRTTTRASKVGRTGTVAIQTVQTRSVGPTPVLAALRAATGEAHRRLDRSPVVLALLDAKRGVAGYRHFMRALHRCYAGLEPGLLRLAGDEGPAYRRRLPALRRELRQLGIGDADASRPAPPLPASAAAYWGTRYVLDGSCHGAERLGPVLTRRPALASATDFAYWATLRGITPLWPAILARLEAHGQAPAERRAMLAAAGATFAYVQQCFAEEGP